MSALYPKQDLIETTFEFFKEQLPDENVTREDLDSFIDRIDENGKIVYSRKTDKNIVLETIFVDVVVGVLSALITEAIKAGVKQIAEHYKSKKPELIQKEIDAPSEGREGEVALQVIVFVQQGNYPPFELPPAESTDQEP